MTTGWTLTFDCVRPGELAAFWKLALGYVDAPPPEGFASWADWLRHFDVPEDEWDDGASIVDPNDGLHGISFLRVPEPKVAKNRIHLDVQAGGGRHIPAVVWILRKCVWWVPYFSVDRYRDKLRELHDLIRHPGAFGAHSTRRLIEAQN